MRYTEEKPDMAAFAKAIEQMLPEEEGTPIVIERGDEWINQMYEAIAGNERALLLIDSLLELVPDLRERRLPPKEKDVVIVGAGNPPHPRRVRMPERISHGPSIAIFYHDTSSPDGELIGPVVVQVPAFIRETIKYINRHELPEWIRPFFKKNAFTITYDYESNQYAVVDNIKDDYRDQVTYTLRTPDQH